MPPKKGQTWKRSVHALNPPTLKCELCPNLFQRCHSQQRFCRDCSKARTLKRMKDWNKIRFSTEEAREKQRDYFKRYYENNKERVIQKTKDYRQTESGRLATKKTDARMRQVNPQKVAARQMVRIAVRAGVIKKRPCEVCGNTKVEAHHEDYSLPLEVKWLCIPCHTKEHKTKPKKKESTNA